MRAQTVSPRNFAVSGVHIKQHNWMNLYIYGKASKPQEAVAGAFRVRYMINQAEACFVAYGAE